MAFQVAINLLDALGREGLVAEGGGRIDVELPALMVEAEGIELARADVRHRVLVFGEVAFQTLLYVAVQPLRLGAEGGGEYA